MNKNPLPSAVFRLDKSQLQKMYGPCVYFFHKDRKALYIGTSAYSLQRVFDHDNSPLCKRRAKAMREADGLTVLFFSTEQEASQAQAWWIEQARPTYQNSGDWDMPKERQPAPGRKKAARIPRPQRVTSIPINLGRMKRPICQATSQRYAKRCPCPPCKRYREVLKLAAA
jgi:hypothetical protein